MYTNSSPNKTQIIPVTVTTAAAPEFAWPIFEETRASSLCYTRYGSVRFGSVCQSVGWVSTYLHINICTTISLSLSFQHNHIHIHPHKRHNRLPQRRPLLPPVNRPPLLCRRPPRLPEPRGSGCRHAGCPPLSRQCLGWVRAWRGLHVYGWLFICTFHFTLTLLFCVSKRKPHPNTHKQKQ